MTTFTHHEPAGTCGVCDEHAWYWRTYWNDVTPADLYEFREHVLACDVAQRRVAEGKAQLEWPRLYAALLVALAPCLARGVAIELPAREVLVA